MLPTKYVINWNSWRSIVHRKIVNFIAGDKSDV